MNDFLKRPPLANLRLTITEKVAALNNIYNPHSRKALLIYYKVKNRILKTIRKIFSFAKKKNASLHKGISKMFFRDVLQMSLTEVCNLRCRHCTKDNKSQPAFTCFPLEDFERFLSMFDSRDFHTLLLSDFGESTLIPNFLEYLRYAKNRYWGCIQIVTKGTRGDQKLWSEIIKDRLLDWVLVSIESADKRKFEYISGYSFDKFKAFLDTITSLRNEHNPNFFISLNACSMKYNLKDLTGIIELAHQYDIRSVHFFHLNSMHEYLGKDEKLCLPDQHLDSVERKNVVKIFNEICFLSHKYGIFVVYPEHYPEVAAYSKELDLTFSTITDPTPSIHFPVERDPRIKTSRCQFSYRWLQVKPSGDIYPCCQMGGRYSLGNLNEMSVDQIYSSNRAIKFLERLQTGCNPPYVCQKCNILRGKNF